MLSRAWSDRQRNAGVHSSSDDDTRRGTLLPIVSSMLRLDCHSHTNRSPDGWMKPAELVERAREIGLDRIVVTDHGEIEGALEAHSLAPELVIVGEEITAACGTDVIGVFVTERIPQRLPFAEVVERLRAQGAIIYAPHPFAYARSSAARAQRVLAVADVAEVFNARAFLPRWNRDARQAAASRQLPMAAGSDAHFGRELGRAYTEVPDFRTAAELRAALRATAPVCVRLSSPFIHLASGSLIVVRKMTR